jgi:hypothetical protein
MIVDVHFAAWLIRYSECWFQLNPQTEVTWQVAQVVTSVSKNTPSAWRSNGGCPKTTSQIEILLRKNHRAITYTCQIFHTTFGDQKVIGFAVLYNGCFLSTSSNIGLHMAVCTFDPP